MSRAPSAQLIPTASGRACATEAWKASIVWPDRVRPLLSVMVAEITSGSRTPRRSHSSAIANNAAFAFSVSKIVSTRRMSTPPSSRPRTWVA